MVANQIYAVEIAQSGWIPRVIPSLRYQHSDFPGSVHVDIVAPGVEVSVTPDVAVLGSTCDSARCPSSGW